MLQAVNCEDTTDATWSERLEFIRDEFTEIGLRHVVHTGDWARELDRSTVQPHQEIRHRRCQLTASTFPLRRRSLSINTGRYEHRYLKNFATVFPEKILVTQIKPGDSTDEPLSMPVEFWNVGVIYGSGPWGEEKINALETIAGRLEYLTTRTDHHYIVGGDFNGPHREHTETDIEFHGQNKPAYTRTSFYGSPYLFRTGESEPVPWTFSRRWQRAEQRMFDPDVDIGLRDAYWTAAESPRLPSHDDFSHVVHSATPPNKRLDHILVSDGAEVLKCQYLQKALRRSLSDHAPVAVQISL